MDYTTLYRASNELTPIVFVLSPGADPAFDVFRCGVSLRASCIYVIEQHQL